MKIKAEWDRTYKQYLMMENIDETIKCAREGFIAAKNAHEWYAQVNNCPYGPAWPNGTNWRAEAWYDGYWYYFSLRDTFSFACDSLGTTGD